MDLAEATAIVMRQIEKVMYTPPVKALPEADCQLDSRGVCMFHHVEHEEPA